MQRILNYFSDTMVYIEHKSTLLCFFLFSKGRKIISSRHAFLHSIYSLTRYHCENAFVFSCFSSSSMNDDFLLVSLSLSLSPKRINDESWKDYVITLEWRALFEHETLRIIGFLLLLYVHRFQTNSP